MGCARLTQAVVGSIFAFTFIGTVFNIVMYAMLDRTSFSNSLALLQSGKRELLIGPTIGLVLGLLMAISTSIQVANGNWLAKHGRRLLATVVDINKQTGTRTELTANGDTRTIQYDYFILKAEWLHHETNTIHIFESEYLPTYPSRLIEDTYVEVLVDPHNLGKYRVNVNGRTDL